MGCKSNVFAGAKESRKKWSNWNGDVAFKASEYFEPDGLTHLVHVVARATKEKRRLRAIGSGWAFEDIAASDAWVVSLKRLDRRLTHVVGPTTTALTPAWTSKQASSGTLVHVEAGIEVGALNLLLAQAGLALPTLGGSNGQSLAGAISTSTHGGDWEQPPLPDVVRAIHLVTDGGRELWIERASEPLTTDAQLRPVLTCADTEIVRDDGVFDAAVVSFGRFGVIYAFVLEVRKAFRVVEVVTRPRRARALQALRDGQAGGPLFMPLFSVLDEDAAPAALAERSTVMVTSPPYFFQLIFNSQDPEDCWAHRRWETTVAADLPAPPTATTVTAEPVLDGTAVLLYAVTAMTTAAGVATATVPVVGWMYGTALLALAADMGIRATQAPLSLGAAVALVLNAAWKLPWLGNVIPEIARMVIAGSGGFSQAAANGRRGPHHLITSGSRAGSQNIPFRTDSIEVVFDATTAGYLDFLDALLAAAPAYRQCGAIAVRPSLRSRASLSMHNVPGSHAMSVEIASLKFLEGNGDFMRFIENLALRFGGRPHWGQINKLTEQQVFVLYGGLLTAWREALVRVSANARLFSNRYTRQRGLEPMGLMREVTGVVREPRLKRPPGRVTHLLGGGAAWSPVPIQQAIREIESGAVIYFTGGAGREARIHVATRGGRKYLRTSPDGVGENNLE
jgi:FAD/FMN-containing dehydrogenase